MHLRRVPALTAALAVALVFGLSACATSVTGKPLAAAGGGTGKTTSSKPPASSTKTSSPKTTEPTDEDSGAPDPKKPSGNVKITTKKKTEGYDDCALLTPEDVTAAVGAAKGGEPGCVQSTEEPYTVVLFMLSPLSYEGEPRTIEVGGNTAYEIRESGGDCTVLVMLTDDSSEVTPAFMASVTPIDEIDPCPVALKLATKGFEKIPNA
ncbi:DUF3558 domain-containing protein [Saccharothrix syringae]|uniref:DUF3558 domain-containing protein n=1 Tax=Saccharothrix syringae TaxID=103733 RepID=A0A5Q0GU89_SACSY|nr:DUF3558 domain-containing protein [Saccharothrix syringae]QFZ17519.1 hypothetical protein EKG83_08535 [Saccharothrix syringae]